ncbi:hypothetical protein KP509_15G051100 [Ceratopteris richardii]|nr:hypothetical protein KP509_15G051100 [Ceratopteris richardii]
MDKAQEICNDIPVRTVVTWNILITGYIEHGRGEEALHCYQLMQDEGLSPNASTFTCVLKACAIIGVAEKVLELHARIESEGLLEKDLIVGTTLVDTYGKLDMMKKAQEVFDRLPVYDTITWNVLIMGYARHGHAVDALYYFEKMQQHGFYPGDVAFIASLKACAAIMEIHRAQELHAEIVKVGFDQKGNLINNALIDLYAKCDLIVEAQTVFDNILIHDVVSFGALIAAYAHLGYDGEAMLCFNQMLLESVSPNEMIYTSILKVCSNLGVINRAFYLHSQIVKEGLSEELNISRALMDMYSSFGLLQELQEVFDRLLHYDVFSFNLLIAGFCKNGYDELALSNFEKMKAKGLSPNSNTIVCILRACANIGASDKGQQIHEQVIRCHSLETDLAVGTSLVDMYARCGLLEKAQEVFDALPVHDLVSWNALIGGYCEQKHSEEAMSCFDHMKNEGFLPDTVTFLSALKACSDMQSICQGMQIHIEIEKIGSLDDDPMIGTALVDMYVTCGHLIEAQHVFDGLPNKDLISWNTLIAQYAKSGHDEEALMCFEQMQLTSFSGNVFTFSSVLKSCARIGTISIGLDIHRKAVKGGLVGMEIMVGNALIDMYSNLGMLERAQTLFDSIEIQDIISWNALMGGYSQLGNERIVFELLDKMMAKGMHPDIVTLSIVLKACSHTGLLEMGQTLCETITKSFDIKLNIEHYICMVDLFGRTGHLDKVACLIREMPVSSNSSLWLAVLDACQKCGQTNLGILAFHHVASLNRRDAAAYISFGNML